MNIIRSRLYLFTYILILTGILYATPCYAAKTDYNKIKGFSSKQNQRIYNKMAIDLVNNQSKHISVDEMIKLIKGYDVVKFDADSSVSARDMIIREIAYRMIKQNYLPRIGDQIRVYKQTQHFSSQIGLKPKDVYGYQAHLLLPMDTALIKHNKTINTIHWVNTALQASSAIEKLWVNRINNFNAQNSVNADASQLFSTLDTLRLKYDMLDSYADFVNQDNTDENSLLQAVEAKIEQWYLKGAVSKENLPVLASLLKQYILLSSQCQPFDIEAHISGFKDIDSLRRALISRIEIVMNDIKEKDPSDYAAIAMLQGLLKDITDKLSILAPTADNKNFSSKPLLKRR
jgi:hypothetical protein